MMEEQKCCENCDKCAYCQGKSEHGMEMDCCKEHAMSREHLEMKKKKLEEKLAWVIESLKQQQG